MIRRHKYGARPTRGKASRLEADYGDELRLLEQAGAIHDLVAQPTVDLVAGIRMRPDYAYTQPDGVRVWVDVKGFETPEFRLKARLWMYYGPGPLKIVKRVRGQFVVDRIVTPGEPHDVPVHPRPVAPRARGPRRPVVPRPPHQSARP